MSGAWAATETYDFEANISSWAGNAVFSGDPISHASGTNVKLVSYNGNTLGNRFASSYSRSSGGTPTGQDWWIRSGAGWNCLTPYTGNTSQYYLSILDLSVGDKVTITFAGSITIVSTNAGVEANTAAVSNQEYTMTTAGHLDLSAPGNSGVKITKVVIETVAAETMGAPSINVRAKGTSRTITIIPGVGNGGSSATATYYTTDGSDPSNSENVSRILYSTPFDITTTKTIRTVSYLSSTVGTEYSEEVSAGTAVTLNAPTITLTNFTAAGSLFTPTYTFTSSQSDLVGSPEATITYSFAGGDDIEASTYNATTSGSITVTVSADGYTSSQTTQSIVGGYFYKSYSFDAINDVTVDTSADIWGSANNVNGAGWSHTNLSNCTYSLRSDIELTGFMYARATTAKTKQGFYTRTGAGSISFTLNSGEYIEFTTLGNNVYSTLPATSQSFSQWTAVRAINIYTPLLTLADGSAVRLTFDNAGGAFKNNWMIDFYSSSTKVANVRADWWDGPDAPDPAGSGAGFTYPYTYSSDGGATPDNTDVWGTFATDMADADIDLTLSYTGGTLYVIGTMTHDTKVYYVNFSKSGLSGDLTYNLYGNNATLSNITTAAASVLTTPAHPTSISTTIGTTGYSTFASTLYPLDLSTVSGATAYYAKTVDTANKKVVFESTEASVPAGEGLLLKGAASAPVTINIADAGTAIDGNLLVGCTAETPLTQNANQYVLAIESGKAVFQSLADQGATIPAGKAYLNATGADARQLSIVFEDASETTGIGASLTKNEEVKNGTYNLQGQRVAQPRKGLYIVGGKKVVVK